MDATILELLPLVRAGFPSPADDHLEQDITLDELLISNRLSTFYVRVEGSSMQDAGIFDGDVLIIDKSQKPEHGKIALCVIDGEFTVKRLRLLGGQLYLEPANKEFKAILVSHYQDFRVWGIVTYIIHKPQ